MTDQVPSTPRPKLRLVAPPPSDAGEDPEEIPGGFDTQPSLADTEPVLHALAGHNAMARRDSFKAARTLVWLAQAMLEEVARGAACSAEEWGATRSVLEAAVRYLVVAQAQKVVEPQVAYPAGPGLGLLEALRRLCRLASLGGASAEADSNRVWEIARRLDLATQCLRDWTTTGEHGVRPDEVGALAKELGYVYRDLRPLTGETQEGN